jgi:hypothetical protein
MTCALYIAGTKYLAGLNQREADAVVKTAREKTKGEDPPPRIEVREEASK